jgi:glycosyltransferase involved in cell wall biosynthesis
MDVYYLIFDKQHFYLTHNSEKEIVGKATTWMPMYFHTKVYYDMHRAVLKTLGKIHFDYVYWRGAPVWRSSYTLAKKLHAQGTKILYEIPTYVKIGEEQQSVLRKAFSAYEKLWKTKFTQYLDLIILIFTGDTTMDTLYGKPVAVIDNGVDVDAIPLRKPKKHENEIHILALASMSYWHGYDRLIRSLSQYTGDRKIVVHMVGGNDGGMLPEWQKLAQELNVQDKVIFHGKMFGDTLGEMFDMCDVGVNALAQYRKNLGATSELKVREYTARGLPFLCSVEDPALNHAEEPFWLRVANDESVLDMEQITDFVQKMGADQEHPGRMRAYAKKYMTWESQYAPIFEKLEREG